MPCNGNRRRDHFLVLRQLDERQETLDATIRCVRLRVGDAANGSDGVAHEFLVGVQDVRLQLPQNLLAVFWDRQARQREVICSSKTRVRRFLRAPYCRGAGGAR